MTRSRAPVPLPFYEQSMADTLRVGFVQDFNGIAIEGGDNGAGVICRKRGTGEKEVKECGYDNNHRTSC